MTYEEHEVRRELAILASSARGRQLL
ncbi:MAG: hypothetical protein QOF68_403, partial [Gaiellales bacterium]|nr:hypothetical protein [Gaiellales bacterium]